MPRRSTHIQTVIKTAAPPRLAPLDIVLHDNVTFGPDGMTNYVLHRKLCNIDGSTCRHGSTHLPQLRSDVLNYSKSLFCSIDEMCKKYAKMS